MSFLGFGHKKEEINVAVLTPEPSQAEVEAYAEKAAEAYVNPLSSEKAAQDVGEVVIRAEQAGNIVAGKQPSDAEHTTEQTPAA